MADFSARRQDDGPQVAGCRTGPEMLAEMVHRVLGHHHGRVDKDADRDRDPGQRHDVRLDIHEPDPPQDRHDRERAGLAVDADSLGAEG